MSLLQSAAIRMSAVVTPALGIVLGVGNISILSYIVILRAHDNRIMVVFNYRHIVFTLLVVLLHKVRHTFPKI